MHSSGPVCPAKNLKFRGGAGNSVCGSSSNAAGMRERAVSCLRWRVGLRAAQAIREIPQSHCRILVTDVSKVYLGWEWCHIPVIPALGGSQQENLELVIILGHIVCSSSEKNTK